MHLVEVVLLNLLLATGSLSFLHKNVLTQTCVKLNYNNEVARDLSFRRIRFGALMAAVAVPETDKSSASSPPQKRKADFSSFKVGQQFDGKVASLKNFGVFVEIAPKINALIPKSKLSNQQFSKLKTLAESKSEEPIKVELIGVSAENQTISAKYLSGDTLKDYSSLEGKDLQGKAFNATIVSKHTFGVFARINELGVDGLVPTSKIPKQLPADNLKNGAKVVVQIDEINPSAKKLVLSIKAEAQDVSALTQLSTDLWMSATVQSVTSFGLFVRPSGYDVTGLVYRSRVPRELVSILKRRVSPDAFKGNKTDIEAVFRAGDVVKVRVQTVNVAANRLELSMMPGDEGDDDYVPDYMLEEALQVSNGEEGYDSYEEDDGDMDDDSNFDVESTLLWWRGAPYVRQATLQAIANIKEVDEDEEVTQENERISVGNWRRMFELDMREDEADFSSKAVDLDLKEIADEIGELEGMEIDLASDPLGSGIALQRKGFNLGISLSPDQVPESWRAEMDFFRMNAEETEGMRRVLRGGKALDDQELAALLEELEQSVANGSSDQEELAASAVESEEEDVDDEDDE